MNDYQEQAARTMNKRLDVEQTVLHALHGMSAEVGEIHSIFQKYYQGHAVDESKLMAEVGDLLWMIAEYCTAMGWKLDYVARANIDKLKKRYPAGFEAERSLHRQGGI